ncbi:MAG TPA: hypothetical protein VLU92_04245 [Candidatus Dormibacteraeota bacterium]|nr:hypothetical protein [Candidatus Dormibacteraeota bacterium]
MTSTLLFKICGWTLGLGSVAYIVLTIGGDIVLGQGAQHFGSPLYAPVSALQGVAGFLMLVGFAGHYGRQHSKAGRLGFLGAVSLSASIALYAFALPVMSAIMFSWLAAQPATRHALEGNNGPGGLLVFFILSTVLNVVGIVCYGVATWRAGIAGKAAAGVLVAGGVLALVGFFVGSSSPDIPAWVSDLPGQVFIAALAWLGWQLSRTASAGSPALRWVGQAG